MKRFVKHGSKTDMTFKERQYIFQNCGDFRLTAGSGSSQGHFVDPLLKLYHNIPLIFVTNDDVPNGHAYGTRVILQHVFLKPGCSTTETVSMESCHCHSVNAHDIDYILCTLDGHPEKSFKVSPKVTTCHVKAPLPSGFGAVTDATITFKISMTQLPVLVNNATTGHKLQGQTKENLVISVWSKKRNWNYVALSRVTSQTGLFLVSPLPHNVDFSISPELANMLQTLRHMVPDTLD